MGRHQQSQANLLVVKIVCPLGSKVFVLEMCDFCISEHLSSVFIVCGLVLYEV